jgi:hypothetical protein
MISSARTPAIASSHHNVEEKCIFFLRASRINQYSQSHHNFGLLVSRTVSSHTKKYKDDPFQLRAYLKPNQYAKIILCDSLI